MTARDVSIPAESPRAESTGAAGQDAPLRALVAELWRMMPGRMSAAVAITLAATAAEAVGLLLLVQLLGLVGLPVPEGSVGGIGRVVGRAFAAVGVAPTLGAVLALYVVVMSAQAAVFRAQNVVAHALEQDASARMRARLYEAAARARWPALVRARGTDLLHALTDEADRVGYAASYLLTIATQVLVSAVYLGFALRVSAPVTLVALGCGGVVLLLLRGQRRAARVAGEGLSEARAALVGAASEHLGAVKTIKSYGAEERNVAHFGALVERTVGMHMDAARAFADARLGLTVGSLVLLAVATWVGIGVLELPATLAILLVFLFARLVPRLTNLQQMQQMLVHHLPAYASVRRWTRALEAERERAEAADPAPPLERAVRLEGVSFAYGDGLPDAVRGVSLAVEARRTTAVVGSSGAGKTTVADLVMGLVRPREGAVTVDGRALEEAWVRSWRGGIGYVAQDTLLFHDTVLANVRWARPEATEAEVWEALRAAAADGFVSALPEGLLTVVGDRGVRLSGGERQRLALARALLRRPALLILDEATSALDAENERKILAAIRALHGKTTILAITHRLSSVQGADVIHVMEGGRLVESGAWDDLLARPGGRLRALWKGGEREEEGDGGEGADARP